MSSFQIWWLLQFSKKLARGQQRAEKAKHFEKRGENLQLIKLIGIRSVTWLAIKAMSWRGRSKDGHGSPIYERVRKKIVEYFKNNVPQRQIEKAFADLIIYSA